MGDIIAFLYARASMLPTLAWSGSSRGSRSANRAANMPNELTKQSYIKEQKGYY